MTDACRYGLMAEFDSPRALVKAAREARRAGYRPTDAFAPFPVPGLPEALGFREHLIPVIALGAGLTGALLAFGLQWYSAVLDYPYLVAGKPLNSWPAFLPITFEVGILSAVLSTLIAMLALNRLPQPYHPVFNEPRFERASEDGFFLLFANLPSSDWEKGRDFLREQGAVAVQEVAP